MKRPVIFVFSSDVSIKSKLDPKIKDQDVVSLFYYSNDDNFLNNYYKYNPDILLTFGLADREFVNLYQAEWFIRKKWLHYTDVEKYNYNGMYYCYVYNLQQQSSPQSPQPTRSVLVGEGGDGGANNKKPSSNHPPLISIFTPSYKSGDKIYRPLKSLQKQTYPYWEWIIINDSPDDKDNWELLKSIKKQDGRIRIYQPDQNTANIGQLKFCSASMGRGEYLVELDHDDDLSENCLEMVVDAFSQYPEAGFVYTDCCELYEKTYKPFAYGARYGLDYGAYYAEMSNIPGKSDKVLTYGSPGINQNNITLRDIVGVPNHIRVWKKSVYQQIGGHHPLPVADDYELLLRTFLVAKFVKIPYLSYFQYRNIGGNTTFKKNPLIRMLQHTVYQVYHDKIQERLKELDIENQGPNYILNKPVWEQPYNYIEKHGTLIYRDPNYKNSVSVIISTYNNPSKLRRALDSVISQFYKNIEIIVIGDKCPFLNKVMEDYKDEIGIRWWNLYSQYDDNKTTTKNYALRCLIRTEFVTYLDDDTYWLPDHISSLMENINNNEYAFSYSSHYSRENNKVDNNMEGDLKKINKSCILHSMELIEKHGYWRDIPDAVQELVERWNIKCDNNYNNYNTNKCTAVL